MFISGISRDGETMVKTRSQQGRSWPTTMPGDEQWGPQAQKWLAILRSSSEGHPRGTFRGWAGVDALGKSKDDRDTVLSPKRFAVNFRTAFFNFGQDEFG